MCVEDEFSSVSTFNFLMSISAALVSFKEIQLDGFTTGQFPKLEGNFWDLGKQGNDGGTPGRQTVIKKGFSSPNNDTWGERLDSSRFRRRRRATFTQKLT